MIEMKDAALREQRIKNHLYQSKVAMSIKQLFTCVDVAAVSPKGVWQVQETVRSLHKRGLVIKTAAPWKGNEKVYALTTVSQAPVAKTEPVVTEVTKPKPNIIVTEHKVVIELDTIRITVEVP